MGSNPAADKSLVFEWKMVGGGPIIHRVLNHTPLVIGDFTIFFKESTKVQEQILMTSQLVEVEIQRQLIFISIDSQIIV